MTIKEAHLDLKTELSKIYNPKEAANISDLAIEKIISLNKIDRLLNKETPLSTLQRQIFIEYKKQLFNHKPVQYVLHEAWFAGIKFYVDESVLIPRPETEELVEWIVEDAKSKKPHSSINILDIGTGSGCIAIALQKKLKNAEIFALDISNEALNIAQKNAAYNNVQIHFFQDDILKSKSNINSPLYDVIVSNPPYITHKEINELDKNVTDYEPHIALFVSDEDPLLFYKRIIEFALSHLKQKGNLYFEIHENFGNEIVALLNDKGFDSTELKKDLQCKNRMVKAVYNSI